jgi:hypothetical protein
MLRLIALLVLAALPATGQTQRFAFSQTLDLEGQRVPVSILVRLDAVNERTIEARADGDLRHVQAVLPDILSDVLDLSCTRRIAYRLDRLRAEGGLLRANGTVEVTLYGCNGFEDLSYRVRFLTNTTTVEAVLAGGIEAGCVTARLNSLQIQPSGLIGAVLDITGLATTIADDLRGEINAALDQPDNCLDLPEALQALNTRVTRGGFRDLGDGMLGFFIEGGIDVTAPNVLSLLGHLEAEGLVDQ